MPCYDGLTSRAARAFFQGASPSERSGKSRFRIERQVGECSLLDAGNSGLWCWALNASQKGKPIDYYAQLHSDVQPEDGWLDKMIDEMEAHDLDVLSLLVPIKDPNGVTSTAIGHPNGNPFDILCRVTMREAFGLPMTFTAADLGHPDLPLLINTGCFVCRFDWRWAYACKFMSQTQIVFDREKEHWFAKSAPEDWEFARCLHRAERKVGVTRRVRATHRGKNDFANTHPWGAMRFDTGFTKVPVIQQQEQPDRFPFDVDGWLSEAEGAELSRLATGKRVLEVGSYCGRSTICLARTAEQVVAVDPFKGEGVPNEPRDTLEEFEKNIERYKVADKVTAFVGTLQEYRDPQDFDLIFIDGDHSYEAVKADWEKALALLAPDGVIVFHDYREYSGQHDGRWDPGVTQAVKELLEAGAEMLGTCDSLAIVQPVSEYESLTTL